MIKGGEQAHLIDVRTSTEYRSGHASGAISIPLVGAGLIVAGMTRWCGMARLIALMRWNRGTDCSKQVTA